MSSREERMSSCIVYNLTILTYAIKPNEHLEEFLTEGLFIKSNTQAFIQVTYYLFNILDPKEFRKKFYWPIIDKKSENAYRTSSVEFINSLIDKFNLKQEKIKLVSVVHPSGRKFMSLILDLIIITLKEVMKNRNYSTNVSLNLEKAEEIVNTMHELESELEFIIDAEVKSVRDKTNEIRDLINSIYPNDNPVPFDEFISNWTALNRTRLAAIKEQKGKVNEIYNRVDLLQQKGHEMLRNKEYKIIKPSDDEIKELSDFYQNMDIPIDKQLNIISLILHLESSLSVIQNYIQNFSFDEVEISDEEMRIVKRKLEELKQFEPLIHKLNEKEQILKDKVIKLKEEHEIDKDEVPDDDEKIYDEACGKEVMRTVISPKLNFETSKSSMNKIHKKHKLVFSETECADHSILTFNQSRLYRPLSDTSLNRSKEMGPPKLKDAPSRRRKRDPMAILDKALAPSKSKQDLNSTAVKHTTSTPFSSTMLSPDLIHHANFSMISNISSVVQTPQYLNVPNVILKPDVLDVDKNSKFIKTISLEETFERKLVLYETDQNVMNMSVIPRSSKSDDTIQSGNIINDFSSSCENTVCEKENFGNELDTIMFTKKPACDEDLFNVSDSVLVDD